MTERPEGEVAGEHALREGEVDRLGFGEVASRIANSIVDRASVDGLVIGLDGQWGSGKSSLLHLIERSLRQLPEERRPTIINFRPWLVGNRDALLSSLFNELAEKIAHVRLARGDATDVTKQKAQRAAQAVRKFARALSKTGQLVEALGDIVPTAGFWGRLLQGGGAAAAKSEEPTDLAALKDEIVRDLRDLGHRFIITVDDVDRLEPAEVIEVLRLVRSVADFPNINYLLCYDAERLAEAIESGAKIKNGAAYLEKIVQLTVMIPTPEPFELRQWFAEDLEKVIGSVPKFEIQERLKAVIDQEGGTQLRTPRSVVRTLDSIRFFWPAMRDESVDVPDLVWLQLIKDGAPKLYRWIEAYVASMAAISFGTASVSDSGKAKRLKALIEASDGQLDDLMYRHMFAEQLPGVEPSLDDDGPPIKIHQKFGEAERKVAIDGRRLASPDHYRLYFSLIGPAHAVTQDAFDTFWRAAEISSAETAQFLLDLHKQRALGSLRKSDVLFERLRAMDPGLWTSKRASNLLLALGQMMDDAYRIDPTDENFVVSSWDRAERLVPILYAQLADSERAAINEQLFSNGAALGWLTSVLRTEIFAHGRYGDQKKPPEKWLMPEAEFERACDILIQRYQSLSMDEVLATPRALHILFAWNQAGDQEGPRALVADAIETDEGLVNVLSAFTTPRDSSDRGRYDVLKRENVMPFADYDSIVARLRSIAASGPSELSAKAKVLVQAVDSMRF